MTDNEFYKRVESFKRELSTDYRNPIFKLFGNSSPDYEFDKWWYQLPLRKKLWYKLRLWFG